MLGKEIGLLLAGLGLTLALACAPAERAAPAPGEGKPKHGGVLNVRVNNDPFDWDLSYVGKSTPNGYGQVMGYNSLLGFEFGPDVKYEELILRPELAERWEVSPDAKAFTFYLRRGVKFANMPPVNGRELTSKDVKWSYEYWSRTGEFKDKKLPQGQLESFFEGLEAIETPDDYTVVVRFKEPFAPFLNYAAWSLMR